MRRPHAAHRSARRNVHNPGYKQQGSFAPRKLLRFAATMSLRNPLVFHRLPGCPVIRLPCSADFATGRGGFLQLLSVSLPSCCRSHPARVARRYSQFATIHAAFTLQLRARPPGKHFRGHLCVHFRYGPMARHHPKDDAVNRFQKFGFPPPCYPSYEASDSYLGGFLSPH